MFRRVLATEVSKSSVQAARYNLAANGIANTALARLSSDEISAALAGRESLPASGTSTWPPTSSRPCSSTHPQRAGRRHRRPWPEFCQHSLYFLQPQTLYGNAAALQASHRIAAAAAFDQFPTHHLECGLPLQRR